MTDAEREAIRTRWSPHEGLPTRLLLARHGATAHSEAGRFSGRNELPLDAHGELQAKALACHLREYAPVQTIISSPLRRARETAAVIAAEFGVGVDVHGGLIEADFGCWEGLTFDEAMAGWPEALVGWLNAEDAAPPGGESFAAVQERIGQALAEIVEGHAGQSLLVVSHTTPIKALLRRALGAPHDAVFRFHVDTGSLSILDSYLGGESYVRMLNQIPPAIVASSGTRFEEVLQK